MFGLMRAKTCGMTAEEKNFRRLHYCGTCKTVGALYGQKSRLLLNHDTVFLAEILTGLSEEEVQNWQKPYQSYNCMSLPENEMPLSLQFAATANVILAEFKLADQISDTRQKRFKLAHRIFSQDFIKAEKKLREWNFPLQNVREVLQTQETREAKKLSLHELSLPTAETTALFFAEGVKLIKKENLATLAYEIGFSFGKLIYLLDAFEDFEKDAKNQQFNAFAASLGNKEKGISLLLDLENEIISRIYDLPLEAAKKQIFASRLRSNLQKKIQTEVSQLINNARRKPAISDRFKRAKMRARELTANYSLAKALPIFVLVLAIAFIAPAQAKEAKSARECAELGFNLMFLGSLVGLVWTIPGNLMQSGGGYTPPPMPPAGENVSKELKNKVEGGESSCSYCNIDGCDCCCCCGEWGCCDGGCDGCGGCCDCSCDC